MSDSPHSCGEGACSRLAAKRPQKPCSGCIRQTRLAGSGTAAQSSGSELPRHRGSRGGRGWFVVCTAVIASRLTPTGWSGTFGQSAVIASKLCSYRRSKENQHTAPLPFTTQGRALARLQAFDFDPPAPSGGRVEVFIWGSGAKRRAAEPHTSRGGRREADRRRCPQMDTGARERRALARCRTLGASLFLLTFFWRLKKK